MKKIITHFILLILTALFLPFAAIAQLAPPIIDPALLEKPYLDPLTQPRIDPNQPVVTDPNQTSTVVDPPITDPGVTTDPNQPTTDPAGTLVSPDPTTTQDPAATATTRPTDTTTNQYNPDSTGTSTLNINPRVPTLNYDPTQPTSETNEQPLECPETPLYDRSPTNQICPTPQEILAEAQPTIGNNQMIFSILAMLGALIGGIIWLIGTLFMQKTQIAHEEKRSDRLFRQTTATRINNELEKSWPKISATMGEIISSLETGKIPSKQTIQNFKKSTTTLDLFASKNTINTKNELLTTLDELTTITQPAKLPTQKIISNLFALQTSIKKDLLP